MIQPITKQDAAGDRPPLRAVVMMIVRVMIVADDIAGLVRVRGEAGRGDRVENRGRGDASRD